MTKNHPKTLWVKQGSEFYNKIVNKLLKVNLQKYMLNGKAMVKDLIVG